MAPPTPLPALDPDTRRRLAAGLFNHVWTLLETPGRSADQDDEMLHAAHASRFHWGELETGARVATGEWQCSRVYAVLGRAEPALHHARRSLDICRRDGIEGFNLAFAYEAMARAAWVGGDPAGAEEYRELARRATESIDEEDRELVLSDLATIGA
jgi:hypothetical protein